MIVSAEAEVPLAKSRIRRPWLREVIVMTVIYVVYGIVRNQFGSANLRIGDAPLHAFNNALRIIDLEKTIGFFHEQTIQNWFLDTPFMQFFNIFYGTAHFIVTLGVLIWLFVKRHEHFSRWRTTLMATTLIALVGFALFPLMPPRLLNESPAQSRYGGGDLAQANHLPEYGFVDTLRDGDSLWSFDSSGMDNISNQYAAMPSLHIAWSLWCTIVLWCLSRRRLARVLGVCYPIITLVAIVATANHYIIDAVGGIAIVIAGYLVAAAAQAARRRRGPSINTPTMNDSLVSS